MRVTIDEDALVLDHVKLTLEQARALDAIMDWAAVALDAEDERHKATVKEIHAAVDLRRNAIIARIHTGTPEPIPHEPLALPIPIFGDGWVNRLERNGS